MLVSGNRTLKVARYMLLPQILPRFAELVFGGFSYLAYFVAQVYRGVRLLPEGHPYLNPSEIGNFSIPDVVRAAGIRLKYRRDTIDQVVIFYVILLGMVLIAFQTLLLVIGVFAPQAMAMSLSGYFGNPHLTTGANAYQDLAFIMLDRVFGVPGIFNSCVSMATPCYMAAPDDQWATAQTVYKPPVFPWPFHNALHAMFAFYSTGLLVIGMMILLYLVIVIIAETAQTGVPFGKRFNKVWAPIRLVAALGLLIPVSYGMNSAQYIVLYAAKLGSNFATNGWFVFNAALTNGRMTTDNMIAFSKTPNIGPLIQFMMLAHACKAIEEGVMVQNDRPDSWRPQGVGTCPVDGGDQRNDAVIQGYIVKFSGDASDDAIPLESADYARAREFSNFGDITITFGDRGCEKNHMISSGHATPTCGQLVLTSPTQETDVKAGSYVIQKGYYELVKYMWGEYQDPPGSGINDKVKVWAPWGFCNRNIGGQMVQVVETYKYDQIVDGMAGDLRLRKNALAPVQVMCPDSVDGHDVDKTLQSDAGKDWFDGTYRNYMFGKNDAVAPAYVTADPNYSPDNNGTGDAIVTNILRKGVNAERALITNDNKYNIPIDLMDRGWAGAGLWYNNIARANGGITGAIQATPKIVRFPAMMETVAKAKLRNNKNVSADDLFTPTTGEDSDLQLQRTGEAKAVIPLQRIYSTWKDVANEYKPKTGNAIFDFVNMVFGTQGLFDIRDPGNKDVHPLALMATMGKSLLEASIRNLGIAAGLNIVGGAMGAEIGAGAEVLSNFLFMIVGTTMGAGIILYYVLPFMPFLYFFFAVGAWIKEVFEAMVGVPLWALAHLRIDGDGLSGEAARSGYFMIFEIFLRPIMIVFGLIASVSIFASMATVLNSIFDIAVINAGGANFANSGTVTFSEFARGPIDQLFYTILYAVLMYIIAMSSFKMIDLIPQNIMRWMGVSINAFAAQTGDSAGQMMSTIQQQGLSKVDAIAGGINSGSKGVGNAAKSLTKQ